MKSHHKNSERFVSKVFSDVFDKYDLMNDLMSLGVHRLWKREFIICGDWNIAHNEIDLKNWKSNQKNSGFLPKERAWMTKLFNEHDYIDVFRRLNQNPNQYTWWSNRGKAWEKNVGWRIDYHVATKGIGEKATKELIYKEERFSDHAPLIIDYDYRL